MATQTSIFIPGDGHTFTVAGTTASSFVQYIANGLFAINADQDITIVVGNHASIATATASMFRIPAGVIATYDLGSYNDGFEVYNLSGTTANVYWQELRRV